MSKCLLSIGFPDEEPVETEGEIHRADIEEERSLLDNSGGQSQQVEGKGKEVERIELVGKDKELEQVE